MFKVFLGLDSETVNYTVSDLTVTLRQMSWALFLTELHVTLGQSLNLACSWRGSWECEPHHCRMALE